MRALGLLVPVLGLILLWTPHCPARQDGRVKVKVLILGAGAAGVMAARTLHKNGVEDFLVLEGQDYVGGRMKTEEFMGQKVEAGANWIHLWIKQNPLYQIREQYKLKGTPSNMTNLVIRNSTGDDVTDWNTVARLHAAEKKLLKLQDYYYDEELNDIPVKKALKKVGWEAVTQAEKATETFSVEFEYNVDSNSTSFYGWGPHISDFFVVDPRGFSVFLLDMTKPFQDKILLNKTVNSIQSTENSVLVSTTDGSLYDADYVLCTFSNNVLLSDMVKFQPPLPSYKTNALRQVPTGYYTKIFLKFPRKFWDDKEYILYASGRAERGYYHTWQDLTRPGMFPNTTALLLMTCTSDTSLRVEAQSANDTLKEIMTILRGVYGQGIPDAEGIFYPRWSRNPYTRGSYAHVKVGDYEMAFKNLARNEGRVFFAGDGATNEHYGTIHGAMASGRTTSQKILACVKQQSECPIKTSSSSSQHHVITWSLLLVVISLVRAGL